MKPVHSVVANVLPFSCKDSAFWQDQVTVVTFFHASFLLLTNFMHIPCRSFDVLSALCIM